MSLASYKASLRPIVRAYWSGVFDQQTFTEEMTFAIADGLDQAFAEGAKQCGILPEDYTDAENKALTDSIKKEQGHIGNLESFVFEHRKGEGKLGEAFARLNDWALRYTDVSNQAKALTCKDKKLEWRVGPTEHCRTCAKLNGKVKRASVWDSSGIRPQNPPNPLLVCKGFRCQCELFVTNKPVSKGPLPRVP